MSILKKLWFPIKDIYIAAVKNYLLHITLKEWMAATTPLESSPWMIEWMAQSDPSREATTVQKLINRR